jgi:hypothetical protein
MRHGTATADSIQVRNIMNKMVRSIFWLLSVNVYCWLQDRLAPGVDWLQQQQESVYCQDQQMQQWSVQQGAEATGNNGGL